MGSLRSGTACPPSPCCASGVLSPKVDNQSP
jgi:hypothetical protein